jgi:hypothetical protein
MSIDNNKLTMICCVGDCGRLNYLIKHREIISMVSFQAIEPRPGIQKSLTAGKLGLAMACVVL